MSRPGLHALLLGIVALAVGAPMSSAQALPGSSCDEVTVVVAGSGGEEEATCVSAGPARTAAQIFEDAGHALTRVQRFPGAVCRVDGFPAEDPCVAMPPADSYWGFFVGDGTDWSYATLGVDSVVPEPGDSIALAWQDTVRPVPPRSSSGALRPESPGDSGRSAGTDATADSTADAGTDAGTDSGLRTVVSALAVLLVLAGSAVLGVRRRRP